MMPTVPPTAFGQRMRIVMKNARVVPLPVNHIEGWLAPACPHTHGRQSSEEPLTALSSGGPFLRWHNMLLVVEP